jgi:2-keto-4-pentenoate hydratase/2-oxohepta-3-ene-1,7-dioic acid hydratase in catechol pathway
MKLVQFVQGKDLQLGIVEEKNEKRLIRPLAYAGDFISWLAAGRPAETMGERVPWEEAELAAPVTRPGKIIAIGLNYLEHALEGSMKKPKEPLVFAKFPTAVTGPGAEIQWSLQITEKVDFEAELVVVIGAGLQRAGKGGLEKGLRLHLRQRRQRPRPAVRRQAMGPGQITRHLLPARPLAGDQ